MNRILLVGFFLLSAGCSILVPPGSNYGTYSSNPKVGDGGFLSRKPCGPPCFGGLVPGQATDIDVQMAQQAQSGFFDNCQAYDYSSSGGGQGIRCDGGVGISYNQGLVGGIGFTPAVTITMRQTVDAYGPPDLINVIIVSPPESLITSRATFYYDRFGLLLGPADQANRDFMIDTDTRITRIAYYSTTNYEQLKQAALRHAVAWHGFGTYVAAPSP